MALDLGVKRNDLKRWLEKTAEVGMQNPWYLSAQYPNAHIGVERVGGVPVEFTKKYHGTTPLYFIYRPDLVPVEQVIKKLDWDPGAVGYSFCPEEGLRKLPKLLADLPAKPRTQSLQYTKDFDPEMRGGRYASLRRNLSRTERQYGLAIDDHATYDPQELLPVVESWLGNKYPLADPDELALSASGALQGIGNVAVNPFGRLVLARNPQGDVRALAAVLQMGTFASIERIASYRDVDRAQEYLDAYLWRSFCAEGVERISHGLKGTADREQHKEQFAPVYDRVWFSAMPRCVN